MRENYTLTRLYVDQDLSLGAQISLSKPQLHYLASVLRKGTEDKIRLFNGRDGEWEAEITQMTRKAASLTCQDNLRPQNPSPDIALIFAPVRKHRTAFIIEKATELGVSTLQPLITEHTQFSKFNPEKVRLQSIEAAEQTERLDVPHIMPVIKDVNGLIEAWAEGYKGRSLIFADEAVAGTPAAQPAKTVLENLSGPCALLVGPEGGFSQRERKILQAQNFVQTVSLGPRILRADTAALALLTLWQAMNGDWNA